MLCYDWDSSPLPIFWARPELAWWHLAKTPLARKSEDNIKCPQVIFFNFGGFESQRNLFEWFTPGVLAACTGVRHCPRMHFRDWTMCYICYMSTHWLQGNAGKLCAGILMRGHFALILVVGSIFDLCVCLPMFDFFDSSVQLQMHHI